MSGPSTLPNGNRRYDLIAFDVDGTLVGNRHGRVIWQLLNELFGAPRELSEQRARAYQAGAITYAEWVALDVGDWALAQATRAQITTVIRQELYPVPGAQAVLQQLAEDGFRLAVISGTLNVTLETLFPEHPFADVLTNRLWFDDAGFIAGWQATAYDLVGKATALERLAQQAGIPLSRTVFVGDHLNDLHVMEIAGLAIAFEPKDPLVAERAAHVVHTDLRGILPLVR